MFHRPTPRLHGVAEPQWLGPRQFLANSQNFKLVVNSPNGSQNKPSAGGALFAGAGRVARILGDSALLGFVNSAGLSDYLQIGSVNAWVGSGGNVTDAAIGAAAALNFYVGNSTTAAANANSSGQWTWNAPTAGGQTGYTFTGRNGNNTALFKTGAGSGTAFGVVVQGGSTSADYALLVQTQAGADIFRVRGDGVILGQGPVAAANVDMTPDKSTLTLTYVGGPANAAVFWSRQGNQVTIHFAVTSATGTGTSFTASTLPASIRPARTTVLSIPASAVEDAGALLTNASVQIDTSGVATFLKNGVNTWTAGGTRGIVNPFSITYQLT